MKCPKCGAEIKRFDLAPNCKKCGVHIMYYTQEEDLRRDAKKTELEFTSARLLVAKIKAAYIKGKIPVLRSIFIFLSVASLLLPLYNLKLSFPYWQYDISVGALGVYGIISDSFWLVFDALLNLGLPNPLALVLIISFALLLLSAVFIAILFVLWLLSFINIKKTARISVFFCITAIISLLGGTAASFIAINLTGAYEFVSATPLFGGLLGIATVGVLLATNLILSVNEPELPLSSADRERLIILSAVKKGEINIDDLPLPIVKEPEKTEEKTEKKRGKKK